MTTNDLLIKIYYLHGTEDQQTLSEILTLLHDRTALTDNMPNLTQRIIGIKSSDLAEHLTLLLENVTQDYSEESYANIDACNQALQFKSLEKTLIEHMQAADERHIDAILNALTHPEEVLKGALFFTARLSKLENATIKEKLAAIYGTLRRHFENDNSTYKPGNIFYEAMHKLYKDFPKIKDLSKKSKIKVMEKDFLKKIRQFDNKRNEQKSEELESLFNLHATMQALQNKTPSFLQVISEISDKAIVKYSQKIYYHIMLNILLRKYGTVRSILITYKEKSSSLNPAFYPKIDFYLSKIDNEDAAILLQLRNSNIESLEYLDQAVNESIRFNEYKLALTFSHIPPTAAMRKEYKHVVKRLEKTKTPACGSIRRDHPYTNQEADPDILRAIKPEHREMYSRIEFCAPVDDPYMKKNSGFYLLYAQFDAALPIYREKKKTYFNEFKASEEEIKLLCQFHLIESFSGEGMHDNDYARPFAHIHFIVKTINTLKKTDKSAITDDPLFLDEFMKNVEKTWMELWKLGHGFAIDPYFAMQNSRFGPLLTLNDKQYYREVVKQKYLLLAADLLNQLRRFDYNRFITPKHFKIVHETLSRAEQAQFPLVSDQLERHYETLLENDGLIDILSTKINERDYLIHKLFNAETRLPEPTFSAKEQELADKNFREIMAAEEAEEKALEEAINADLEKRRALEEKREAAELRTEHMPYLAQPQMIFPVNEEQSEEAKAYHLTSRLYRHTNLSVDTAIIKYTDIVQQYLTHPYVIDQHYDYFYLCATFVELASCYADKGRAMTKADFFKKHVEQNTIDLIMKQYTDAVNYAHQAETCFMNFAILLPEATQERFANLAKCIHLVLKNIEEELAFIQSKFKAKSENLKALLEKLHASRLAAIERFGGIRVWCKNKAPKNVYASLRKEVNEQYKHVQSSDVTIERFVKNTFSCVYQDMKYLAGEGSIPLAAHLNETYVTEQENNVILGGGNFIQRLVLLTQATECLKQGFSSADTLQMLAPMHQSDEAFNPSVPM